MPRAQVLHPALTPTLSADSGGLTLRLQGDAAVTLDLAPGEEGAGVLAQGFLEASNVDVVQEFVDIFPSGDKGLLLMGAVGTGKTG